MKKIVSLLLALAAAGSLCACGAGSADTAEISKAADEIVAEVSKEVDAAAESVAVGIAETTAVAATEAEITKDAAPAFEPVVLVDNDSVHIEATDAEWDSIWGYQVNFVLENKTDKDLMFAAEYTCVNGWDVPGLFASTVAAGKKSNETLTISSSSLEECGIGDITNITIGFRVYDSNDWTEDPVVENEFVIYPMGEAADKEYKREARATDQVLVDNDDITITITEQGIDDIWGYRVKLYIENKTDKTLMFATENASVNGFMCDPFWAKSLAPHKKAMTSVDWGTYTLEQQKLTPEDVKDIELTFRVYDADNFMSDNIFEQTFTLKAE